MHIVAPRFHPNGDESGDDDDENTTIFVEIFIQPRSVVSAGKSKKYTEKLHIYNR